MPRLIDHAAREVEVAEAAWRVLSGRGVGALSVRTVAAEAGLATGSLRRAFPTQDALLVFSLELVARRVRERIGALDLTAPAPGPQTAVLLELLPLDAERRLEMEVFLHLGSLAVGGGALREVYDTAHRELAEASLRLIGSLVEAGWAPSSLDLPVEARRLHALVDGLALHLVRQDAGAPTDWATDVLTAHLHALRA
ncbi:TetR/AcrR family transcriptional regulator [Modestobacter sp. VKM Ac-2986]|uniref:TetR/AcrR family transcriptional regulator n=1 Tax=Modestobacter sp. VKM Ac-2986 TaxID=3004140 RepID=UPI0022ABA4B9|nr:TetR/AcrR family transcriptional regulator [Modestobacter sp. VKM Ac-2986]MCZ2830991.1 TetR/AcrR family transcriptional regulator [Modestobacter sp. VKM Ac-2986]